jgi:hypothetical protein
MNQLDDLAIASQFAEQEQQQNRLREGQVQHINPASSEVKAGFNGRLEIEKLKTLYNRL